MKMTRAHMSASSRRIVINVNKETYDILSESAHDYDMTVEEFVEFLLLRHVKNKKFGTLHKYGITDQWSNIVASSLRRP
jgi:hypothetical protein